MLAIEVSILLSLFDERWIFFCDREELVVTARKKNFIYFLHGDVSSDYSLSSSGFNLNLSVPIQCTSMLDH